MRSSTNPLGREPPPAPLRTSRIAASLVRSMRYAGAPVRISVERGDVRVLAVGGGACVSLAAALHSGGENSVMLMVNARTLRRSITTATTDGVMCLTAAAPQPFDRTDFAVTVPAGADVEIVSKDGQFVYVSGRHRSLFVTSEDAKVDVKADVAAFIRVHSQASAVHIAPAYAEHPLPLALLEAVLRAGSLLVADVAVRRLRVDAADASVTLMRCGLLPILDEAQREEQARRPDVVAVDGAVKLVMCAPLRDFSVEAKGGGDVTVAVTRECRCVAGAGTTPPEVHDASSRADAPRATLHSARGKVCFSSPP